MIITHDGIFAPLHAWDSSPFHVFMLLLLPVATIGVPRHYTHAFCEPPTPSLSHQLLTRTVTEVGGLRGHQVSQHRGAVNDRVSMATILYGSSIMKLRIHDRKLKVCVSVTHVLACSVTVLTCSCTCPHSDKTCYM